MKINCANPPTRVFFKACAAFFLFFSTVIGGCSETYETLSKKAGALDVKDAGVYEKIDALEKTADKNNVENRNFLKWKLYSKGCERALANKFKPAAKKYCAPMFDFYASFDKTLSLPIEIFAYAKFLRDYSALNLDSGDVDEAAKRLDLIEAITPKLKDSSGARPMVDNAEAAMLRGMIFDATGIVKAAKMSFDDAKINLTRESSAYFELFVKAAFARASFLYRRGYDDEAAAAYSELVGVLRGESRYADVWIESLYQRALLHALKGKIRDASINADEAAAACGTSPAKGASNAKIAACYNVWNLSAYVYAQLKKPGRETAALQAAKAFGD